MHYVGQRIFIYLYFFNSLLNLILLRWKKQLEPHRDACRTVWTIDLTLSMCRPLDDTSEPLFIRFQSRIALPATFSATLNVFLMHDEVANSCVMHH